MNEEYWEQYYARKHSLRPSPFAKWVYPRLPAGGFILDIGCGNGKDTLFFNRKGRPALGIDPHAPDDRRFIRGYWTPEMEILPTDIVYARWFLHAVDEVTKLNFLQWVPNKLFAEFRVIGDTPDHTHFRNLVDPAALAWQLNLRIVHYSESRLYSPRRNDRPLLARLEAERA